LPELRKLPTLLTLLLLTFVPVSAIANSLRAVHPELVGIKTVALTIGGQNLAGLDHVKLETEIENLLEKHGISIDRSAPITLFVGVTYQQLPACPEFVSFRTSLALSEEVPVRRGMRTEAVYVDTWHENEEFAESKMKAGQVAIDSIIGLVKYFLDSAEYSTTVVKKH
jgi:hypothetical protein